MSSEDPSKQDRAFTRRKGKSLILKKNSRQEDSEEPMKKSKKKKTKSLKLNSSKSDSASKPSEPVSSASVSDITSTGKESSSNITTKNKRTFKDRFRNRLSQRKTSKTKLKEEEGADETTSVPIPDTANEQHEQPDTTAKESIASGEAPINENESFHPSDHVSEITDTAVKAEEEKEVDQTSKEQESSEVKLEKSSVSHAAREEEVQEATKLDEQCSDNIDSTEADEKEPKLIPGYVVENVKSSTDSDSTVDLDGITTDTDEPDVFNEAISEVLNFSSFKSSANNCSDVAVDENESDLSRAEEIEVNSHEPDNCNAASNEKEATEANAANTGDNNDEYTKVEATEEAKPTECRSDEPETNEATKLKVDDAPVLQLGDVEQDEGKESDPLVTATGKNTCETLEEKPSDWEYIEHPSEKSGEHVKSLRKMAFGKFYQNMRMSKTYCACCSVM